MDYQNRAGSKFGGGGMATKSDMDRERQKRLARLAMETINIDKDPYIFKSIDGTFECRLCTTTHVSESSYLAHTQGKRHQSNLARRDAQSRKNQPTTAAVAKGITASTVQVKKTIKIGRPGYRITKIRDSSTRQIGLLFQVRCPEIGTGVKPRYRLMSAYEQKVEQADPNYQYIVVAIEPYDNTAFKIEAKDIDNESSKVWDFFDPDSKEYYLQLLFSA